MIFLFAVLTLRERSVTFNPDTKVEIVDVPVS